MRTWMTIAITTVSIYREKKLSVWKSTTYQVPVNLSINEAVIGEGTNRKPITKPRGICVVTGVQRLTISYNQRMSLRKQEPAGD